MSDFAAELLLATPTSRVWDVVCHGHCRSPSGEEQSYGTHLVFPYRGVFRYHVGRRETVAEANQLLYMNWDEAYRVSHPVAGGDASLSLEFSDESLDEIAPAGELRRGAALAFARSHRRIDPGTQRLVALLRHRLRDSAEPLEAEGLALAMVRRAMGARSPCGSTASWTRQKLVDRAKLVLASDLSRRWTLAEIGAEVGVSPVYLTQLFREMEGVPLYRYQLRLRLAAALERLPRSESLTMLGLDLGFSNHSHFTAAFRQTYGETPAAFRGLARRRVRS